MVACIVFSSFGALFSLATSLLVLDCILISSFSIWLSTSEILLWLLLCSSLVPSIQFLWNLPSSESMSWLNFTLMILLVSACLISVANSVRADLRSSLINLRTCPCPS